MKKIVLKLFSIAMCVGLLSSVMVSCGDDEPVSGKTYSYKLYRLSSIVPDDSERKALEQEIVVAIGQNNTMFLKEKADSKMKSACQQIIDRYSANPKSLYLKYMLVRVTHDGATLGETEDEIATFELGFGIATPYASFYMDSEEESAYAALKAKKAELGDSLYEASYKTLENLLGLHSKTTTVKDGFVVYNSTTISSAFEKEFKKRKHDTTCYLDNQSNSNYFRALCDSITNSYANSPLPVEVTLSCSKINVVTGEKANVWTKTVKPNL